MKRTIEIPVPGLLDLIGKHNETAKQAGQMKQAGIHGGKKPKYRRHAKHKGRDREGDGE